MIATSAADGTPCSGDSATSRDLVVPLPPCLQQELQEAFPLAGVRSDTAANNLQLQRIAVLIIDRGLRDRDMLFSFNQKLLEAITNSRQRVALTKFFDNPKRFQTVGGYVPSRNSKVRTMVGTPIRRVEVYQHNGTGLGVGPCLPCPRHWAFSGSTLVPFALSYAWRRDFHCRFAAASERLWPTSMLYESLISRSLADLEIEDVGDADFEDLAHRRHEDGELKATPDQAAAIYAHRWRYFRDHRFDEINRKHGRCYYGLTNQPKDLRRKCLKFPYQGDAVRSVEGDMSSTYPVCLAKKCLDSRYGMTKSTERFIRDIQSGDFYPAMQEASGLKYSRFSYSQMKRKFSIECLFDLDVRFGSSPMCHAFSREYSDPARLVMSIRRKPHGARQLSNMLNEIEGGFFIDLVLPALHALGMPCLPIHDAVMVPEPERDRADKCIRTLSAGYFGFEPNFKWSAAC